MSRFAYLEFGDLREEGGATRAETGLSEEAQQLAEADRAFRAGYFEAALRHCSRVVQLNPHRVPAWAGQVRLLLALKLARQALAQARQLDPKCPEARRLEAELAGHSVWQSWAGRWRRWWSA